MPFAGISFAALDFYEDLEADNSKSFWTAHRSIYDEQVKAPLQELAAELAEEFGSAKFFRPFRDVRFAKDKTPYKTHQGVYFAESRRYLQVSAAGLYASGGYYDMASDQLARYRRAVGEELPGQSLVQAIKLATKSRLELRGEQLSRIPSGFAKDHPRQELLRHKSVWATREFGCPDWLQTPRAKAELVRAWRAMQPLIDWLDKNVGPSDLPVARRGER
ncbi:DUF2461 domain-containing protein [Jatrophihabitans sp.]|uniref:DUF2461 domain-containing protein n=1 Tax=Jatrophihabitans sp. TaxID=1932789 RepID=UPI002BC01978|nr:DUF2461 domain-containing protein [Jatrophihabitans sp.]